jgi:hypothetical protein
MATLRCRPDMHASRRDMSAERRAAPTTLSALFMKRSSITLISAAVLAVATAWGAAHFFGSREAREPAVAPTALLPSRMDASPAMLAPPATQPDRPAPERHRELALAIERALVAADPHQRETAFAFILPELIEQDPQRVVAMVARQEPGEARDTLRNEVARQWITRDRDAAVAWMKSFDVAEREPSATIAVRTLAASAPAQAIFVADQFGIGRDDGSLGHMVQIWATRNLDEATRWIETQPEDAHTAQLRARIDRVREEQAARTPEPN